MQKVGTSVKSGSSKVAAALSPNRDNTDGATQSPNGKPGPGVYVAMAQISERGQNFTEAEAQYKKALSMDSSHLGAMVGMAHLEDRRGHLEAATKLYLKAAKKHPKDASVHNDLGLCYHRRGMLPEATKSLERAVKLQGESKLYRNNLAAVLVERGMTKEALNELIVAHGESVGHYNLAYLLEQKADHKTALTHFQVAAQKDPSLLAAQQWVARLSTPEGQGGTQYAAAPQYPRRNMLRRPRLRCRRNRANRDSCKPAASVPRASIRPMGRVRSEACNILNRAATKEPATLCRRPPPRRVCLASPLAAASRRPWLMTRSTRRGRSCSCRK